MKRSIPRIVCVALILLAGGEKLCATDVGGLICTNTTWNLAGSPYIVTGSSGIVIGCNATLTIGPGVVVKFNPTLAIVVGSNAFGTGTLVARGTAESPIIFTSIKDPNNVLDPAKPGDWSRIHFTDYAADAAFDPDGNYVSGCILEHVIVEYAGYGNYGAIFAEKSSPFLNYCEVRHNSYYGIQVDGTNAPPIRIANSQVWDHPQRGIYISGGPGSNKLIYNNIHDNRGGGIYFGSAGGNTLTGNTITGNTGGGIYFYVSGSNTLTGNTITGNTGGGIYFYVSGSNTLTGNTLTGNTSASGGGICFNSSGSNTLTGNTITDNTSASGGGIHFSSSGGNTLSGNTITNNTASGNGGGIYFYYGGSNTLAGNTISGNTASGAGGGIYLGSSGSNTLTRNTITGNTASGAGGGIYLGSSGSNTLTGNVVQSNLSGNGLGVVHLDASGDTVFYENTITNNYIETTGATGGIYVTNSERVSLAGNPDTNTYNIIWGNDEYQVYNNNPFDAGGRYDVNAVYVRWGTCDIQQIMDGIFDYFDDGSKAFVAFYPFVCVMAGDFDSDKDVDWLDLATFVENWLRQDCAIPDWCEGTDLDVNTTVDFFDFARFAEHWLEGAGP